MLGAARGDSILCFARCHYGWIYFDSPILAEKKHLHLTRSLLREQIDACHASGNRVPIYITVQWDIRICDEHPEWRLVTPDGCLQGTPPYEAGFYRMLCLNSSYKEFLEVHNREILETLPTDGIYFDYVRPYDCSCTYCRRKMEVEAPDRSDRRTRQAFGVRTVAQFENEMADYVRRFNRDCSVIYNGGHCGLRHRKVASAYSHFELETLLSGGWGYIYFPCTACYARTLGPETVGTTGKFNTTSGDFHSLKNLTTRHGWGMGLPPHVERVP